MPSDAEIRDAIDVWQTTITIPSTQSSCLHQWKTIGVKDMKPLLDLAESYLAAGTEWPELKHWKDEQLSYEEVLEDCRLVHLRIVADKDREIAELQSKMKELETEYLPDSYLEEVEQLKKEIERLKKIVDGITVERIGYTIYKHETGLREELARNNWTAKHNQDIKKRSSTPLAEAIATELNGGKE